jgi:hypothetical protein
MSDVATKVHPLGASRPDLTVEDLPTPEEAFGVRRIGPKELFRYALGPSLIALGISIGSGEWLLGPQAVGTQGMGSVGWVIVVSGVLQTFYNIECSRYVVATGEVPVAGWGRVPPGFVLWVPLAVLVVILAFVTGGWAASAGQGMYALVHGAAPPEGATEPKLWAVVLLIVVFLITALARRISRALELANWLMVGAILLALIVAVLFTVSAGTFSIWWGGIAAVDPNAELEPITATQIGGLAGFTALASGLNWYVMGHYRDKGYGMGFRVGYLSGLRGGKSQLRAVGATFPDTEKNRGLWQRWYRLLLADQWGIFFVGAILGMLLPTLLMARAVELAGRAPTENDVSTFTATSLGAEYGTGLLYVGLLIGVLVLFSTQLGIFEAMVRVSTDAVHATSPKLRAMIDGDPRKLYYPFMIVLLIIISVIVQLGLPLPLVQWSANMSNLGALIFPFMLIYLNSRLPKPARPRPWHTALLLANVLFFGFFFINFVVEQISGSPLF